jgi:hypothetical protein
MNKIIHKKARLSSAQISQLPAFRKARRLILRVEVQEGRTQGRGRTLIPHIPHILKTQARVRARRSPASSRRAASDSGGDDGDGDPEPPRPRSSNSLSPICGGAL